MTIGKLKDKFKTFKLGHMIEALNSKLACLNGIIGDASPF